MHRSDIIKVLAENNQGYIDLFHEYECPVSLYLFASVKSAASSSCSVLEHRCDVTDRADAHGHRDHVSRRRRSGPRTLARKGIPRGNAAAFHRHRRCDLPVAVRRGLAGSGLTVRLSGVPVMRMEIREAVERDRLLYNGIGFLGGCLIAILFFRRVSS